MAETKITYDTDGSIAVTAWSTGLTTQLSATSAIFDNTSTLYMDVLVGGIIELDATTPILGDSLDIYIAGQYSETALDMGGAIDALFAAAGQEVEDVSWVKANMILMKSVQVEATTPAIAQGYHFNPMGVAQFFGGVGIRAGFGTGWKWFQQKSFLLYEDSWVVHPPAEHSRSRP